MSDYCYQLKFVLDQADFVRAQSWYADSYHS